MTTPAIILPIITDVPEEPIPSNANKKLLQVLIKQEKESRDGPADKMLTWLLRTGDRTKLDEELYRRSLAAYEYGKEPKDHSRKRPNTFKPKASP